MRINIGMPVVRTDARSVGHVITKFSGMGRFIYPWCSAGALRARSSAMRHCFYHTGLGQKVVFHNTNIELHSLNIQDDGSMRELLAIKTV